MYIVNAIFRLIWHRTVLWLVRFDSTRSRNRFICGKHQLVYNSEEEKKQVEVTKLRLYPFHFKFSLYPFRYRYIHVHYRNLMMGTIRYLIICAFKTIYFGLLSNWKESACSDSFPLEFPFTYLGFAYLISRRSINAKKRTTLFIVRLLETNYLT